MKRFTLFLVLTLSITSLSAQSTFCDAKYLAANQSGYLDFEKKLAADKKELAQSFTNIPNDLFSNIRILYGGKLGEATIANTLNFIKNPFSTGVQRPIDITAFENLMVGSLEKNFTLIYPFLDANQKSILVPIGFQNEIEELQAFYKFDATINTFFNLKREPIKYYKAGYLNYNNQEFIPTENDEIIAIFNPATGEFHEQEDDFFTIEPSAKYSPINNKIYYTDEYKERVTDFDYGDNHAYQTNKEILIVFENKETEQIQVTVIGTNQVGRNEGEFISAIEETRLPDNGLAISPLSRTLPSVAVDALAQFLVQRTKEELTLAFFDQFRQDISASNEFMTLLPNTNFLLQSQEDLFRIPSMGTVWVESFQSDIQSLLPNLERLILTDTAYQSLKHSPSVEAFRLAYNLVELTSQGESPLNTLAIIQEEITNEYELDGLGEILNLLSIIGNELQNCANDTTDELLTARDLRLMTNTEKKYFTALLYHRNSNAFAPLGLFHSTFLDQLEANYKDFTTTIAQLADILNGLDQAGKNLYKSSYEKTTKEALHNDFAQVAKRAINLIEFGFRLKHFGNSNAYYQSKMYQVYYPLVLNTINAVGHLQREEYGIFLLNVSQILEPIIQEKIANNKGEEKEAIKIIKNLLFYGGFMVDVISATEAQEIGAILQQYALPVGSYRMKRFSHFTLDINAYPGLYMGIESGLQNTLKGNGVLGVTAPIGLAASWGRLPNRAGQSFSVFVPVIDIGAAFSYRWGNQAGGFPKNLSWRQVLSPGIHAVYGFKNAPISLMIGAQFMPQLRSIDANTLSTETQRSVWHFGVSGVVDIPMFNLHLKERR